MKIFIVTGFPEFFKSPVETSILKNSIQKGKVTVEILNLRDFSNDKHKRIDDYPFGGGAGMVLMVEPIYKAITAIKEKNKGIKTILLSPQGELFSQSKARRLSKEEKFILICGHYRGIDERVRQFVDEEISIGDYIVSGGETASLVILDAVARLVPDVIGNSESADGDSFEKGLLDHPHYTKPRDFMSNQVPEVLLSGNHKEIDKWRKK
ncbi:tRNA (guanosine(37)-N1)-methyltransferase TrmD, partial [bacterium]|nr:tRNA (guanosine(37)-N1)-methyltransferase TrmD [bacterium]